MRKSFMTNALKEKTILVLTFMMVFISVLFLSGVSAQAKLSDQQSMKCIDGDRKTKSAFQDLQAAYEMRLVSAKDFFKVMEKPANCQQLKKDLKNLHASAVSRFPRNKVSPRGGAKPSYGSSSPDTNYFPDSEMPHFGSDMPPIPDFGSDFPPPPFPDDFAEDDDFGDF